MEKTNSAPAPAPAPTGCYKCGRTGHWSHDCPDDRPNLNPNPIPRRVDPGKPNSAAATAAATGCYKCGRPGHWARDCPDAPTSDHRPNLNPSSSAANFAPKQTPKPEKPKKVPRTRPKLTPELLLSDDGIGYVLRHFPRAFRYRGRGHEVSDLGNLIGLYKEWHKHLLPYYSFDQFVHKVDKVASSKRVKTCIRELRERVARGGDPTKLHENPGEPNGHSNEQEAGHSEGQPGDNNEGDHFDDLQENMLNEMYQKASEEPSHDIRTNMVAAEVPATSSSGSEHQAKNNGTSSSSEVHITEEQRARMEANKLKALERAAAASSSGIQLTEEQRARMEANRLKALERAAAARARSMQSA